MARNGTTPLPGSRPRRGRLLTAFVVCATVFGLAAPAASAADAAPPAPRRLNILISNDDGYQFPFIRALQGALKAAGHNAVIVAPDTDQSGKGTGINAKPGAVFKAFEAQPGIWSVEGTPADAVGFGLAQVFASGKPDLVISGINAGQNVGSTTNHSGTVGAAITAAEKGVPSIAVSAEYDPTSPTNPFPELPQAVGFTVKLVEKLIATAPNSGKVLPDHSTVNVNYPAHPTGKVAFTNVGRAEAVQATYVPAPDQCPTCYRIALGLNPDPSEPVGNADTTALNNGSVSLSLLDGDWTTPAWALGQIVSIMDNLSLRLRLNGLTA
ncbi:5'/3'-nucleotidase SurE [Yinghuangia seranimata]|uniref:5'/3'-nucleotidase SurE n=1 Tax=Yinghuangia seranimata TaxID=408067 RepID=UPI00248C2467|nr:5'/3'-nucleotidase SurE [Yinghuangia seranimata]MDI2130269.1 5'/3'-nucleotidase SurE [Yinghuangia seranimata]